MSLIVVYFHGYNSSPKTGKVNMLREHLNVPVYAFPANIDPDIAKKEIEFNIDMLLLDNMHYDDKILFVGTSLGAWMASEMSEKYNIPAVIINPSCDPHESLKKYNVESNICEKYTHIKFSKNNKYFFAKDDEVIDNTDNVKYLLDNAYDVTLTEDGGHRFNDENFKTVMLYIKEKYINT